MKLETEQEAFDDAVASLKRMQAFDANSLPRDAELGKTYSFNDALEPAIRLIELFKRLSPETLDDFGITQLNQIRGQADACFNLFDQILAFDAKQGNAHDVKQALIKKIYESYQDAFSVMLPFVGYSLHKSADFQRLDSEARAALQKIKDEANEITSALEKHQADAETALEAIRTVAAEQGVTQKAIYFKNEADQNKTDAETWKAKTMGIAKLLGAYAVLSLGIHKIPFIAPENTYETVQMAISKILIFSVISFVLYLSARNFMSHKHNATVNRHRQNALMTYTTLVQATGDNQQASNAVLIHAASCIYAPQPTGYTSSGEASAQGAKSVIELLSKPITSGSD